MLYYFIYRPKNLYQISLQCGAVLEILTQLTFPSTFFVVNKFRISKLLRPNFDIIYILIIVNKENQQQSVFIVNNIIIF
jgi:hypothetical protein